MVFRSTVSHRLAVLFSVVSIATACTLPPKVFAAQTVIVTIPDPILYPRGCTACVQGGSCAQYVNNPNYQLRNSSRLPNLTACVNYDSDPQGHCASFTRFQYDVWEKTTAGTFVFSEGTCTKIDCKSGTPDPNRPCGQPLDLYNPITGLPITILTENAIGCSSGEQNGGQK